MIVPTQQDEPALAIGCGPLKPMQGADSRPLRYQIFEKIRAAGTIARVDIAKALCISAASVTTITAELIASGFILETTTPSREVDPGRGRPPVALGIAPNAGYAAGIKLSEQSHTAVILDFAGRQVGEAVLASNISEQTFEETLDAAEAVLLRALRHSGLNMDDLGAVGLGIPGVVDNQTGVVPWSPLVSVRNFPMQSAFQRRIGRPVCIDNDANLVTLAELWFGAGRALPDFAVVTIEEGVGMGLVLNHQLYRGAMGLGMELGHTKVQLDGALCRCGQRGCLEAYVADYALVREANTALNWTNRSMTAPHILMESLYDHAKAGNTAAQAIFRRAGRYLAMGLANIVNIFDPSLILLSGDRMRYDYLFADAVLAEMSSMTLQTGRINASVEIHAWGDLLWAQGAAALALEVATQNTIAKIPI